ncbi:uncharacterized protein EI90DRAFT_2314717 [Cantharellus anzutake]|uniref:uncharacterized protein n=1 Tax=Cantharellus anzutake TaxID=1750568 RepID=UPI0019045AC3|nr:uncharacterized protein EI90DRAFT_2314717 [Cantharellus anzutake]KAF8339994.1 hypothetical protein EI90DRAFT_2314717 [Cantharellus anzutake]
MICHYCARHKYFPVTPSSSTMDFPWTADEPTYMADSSTSFHGSDDYSRRPHVSKLDVQAILSPDNTSGAAPITMFWSKPTTEYNGHGFVLLLRYHSRNIQIAIKGERSAPDERLCVDDSPVISGWTTITEKSKIEVGCTSWKLTIRHVSVLETSLVHPTECWQLLDQIEGLTITKLLGKGGSAFVYEVLLGEPPVRYALKVPRDPEYDRVICGEYDVLKYLEKCGVVRLTRINCACILFTTHMQPNVVRAHEIREPKIDLEGGLSQRRFHNQSTTLY